MGEVKDRKNHCRQDIRQHTCFRNPIWPFSEKNVGFVAFLLQLTGPGKGCRGHIVLSPPSSRLRRRGCGQQLFPPEEKFLGCGWMYWTLHQENLFVENWTEVKICTSVKIFSPKFPWEHRLMRFQKKTNKKHADAFLCTNSEVKAIFFGFLPWSLCQVAKAQVLKCCPAIAAFLVAFILSQTNSVMHTFDHIERLILCHGKETIKQGSQCKSRGLHADGKSKQNLT